MGWRRRRGRGKGEAKEGLFNPQSLRTPQRHPGREQLDRPKSEFLLLEGGWREGV